MDKFRTEIEIPEADKQISYSDKLCFVGSCFTENMGKKFQDAKFQSLINPFGIIYNPASVANTLKRIINKDSVDESELVYFQERWLSFEHHGDFSHPNKETCLNQINQGIEQAHEHLKHSSFLFLTFGTAWVYYKHADGKLAANCHKFPARDFERKLLSVQEIVDLFSETIRQLKAFNPELKIICTVSPVRHWKDGAHGNQISKATLLLAIEQVQQNFTELSYFPSYELVLDDLRDYRFFDSDMLHPNQLAVDYIWNKLKTAYIDKSALQAMKEIEKIGQAFSHRPLNPHSEAHKKFLKSFHKKTLQLQSKFSYLNWKEELAYFGEG